MELINRLKKGHVNMEQITEELKASQAKVNESLERITNFE